MHTNIDKVKKYVGSCCGNSFIILDCRNIELDKKSKVNFSIKNIDKYGVDSALFIRNTKDFDVYIEIFEKDGSESDSCGNGTILIAYLLGLNKGTVKMKNSIVMFEGNSKKQKISMDIKFSFIKKVGHKKNCLFVQMGEPHIVYLVDDLSKFDLLKVGEKLQKNYLGGINVNAIQKINDFHYLIRTYERGVFDETKSCGTGSLSSYVAISNFYDKLYKRPLEFKSSGGIHWISRKKNMIQLETLKEFCKIKTLN